MGKDKKGFFPQEVFDAMADEAIEDLCSAGLDHEEIYRILRENLGRRIAQRYLDNPPSAHQEPL